MTYDPAATYRIQRATFGILMIGGLTGALLGTSSLAIVGLLRDGFGGYPYIWDAFILAGLVGGFIGSLCLPFVATTFLRHVSIGRIVVETGVGTIAGAVIGSAVSGFDEAFGTLGAVIGFCIGAAFLHRRSLHVAPDRQNSPAQPDRR
jgi:hypothetical protein